MQGLGIAQQELDRSDPLEEILIGVVTQARFCIGPATYSKEHFYESQRSPWISLSALGSAKIDMPSAVFARLVNALKHPLAPFTGADGLIRSNLTTIVTGTETDVSIELFAKDLVCPVALNSPSRSVELMRGWLAGKQIHYSKIVALRPPRIAKVSPVRCGNPGAAISSDRARPGSASSRLAGRRSGTFDGQAPGGGESTPKPTNWYQCSRPRLCCVHRYRRVSSPIHLQSQYRRLLGLQILRASPDAASESARRFHHRRSAHPSKD